MKIFPAVHYSMGGMWVDFNQMTTIPGLFAAGECEYQYHGANRLGANSLLSAIFGGMQAGPAAAAYVNGLEKARMTFLLLYLSSRFAKSKKNTITFLAWTVMKMRMFFTKNLVNG